MCLAYIIGMVAIASPSSSAERKALKTFGVGLKLHILMNQVTSQPDWDLAPVACKASRSLGLRLPARMAGEIALSHAVA